MGDGIRRVGQDAACREGQSLGNFLTVEVERAFCSDVDAGSTAQGIGVVELECTSEDIGCGGIGIIAGEGDGLRFGGIRVFSDVEGTSAGKDGADVP